jgi:UPF0755 protein
MNPPSSHGPRSSGGPRRGPRSSRGARYPADKHSGERKRGTSRKPTRRRKLPAWLVTSIAGWVVSAAVGVTLLWWWGRSPSGDGVGEFRRIDLGRDPDTSDALDALEAAGLVERPLLFRIYRQTFWPLLAVEPGVHWVSSNQTPDALLALVARSRQRPVVRVTLPEGWDSFQIAERLAGNGICDRDEFLRAVFVGPSEESVDGNDDSRWSSFEGRLYPAAYDFRVDSAPSDVVARLVGEGDKRHQATFAAHQAELARLGRDSSLGAKEVVTLASVVEKEAANGAELPLVASVFLNRLRDPDFRPARALQSDPTAAYGCKRDPSLNSCRQFTGKVTAAMLRDSANAFNTYRHSGLPPTPIGNPSTRAIVAVLTAPATDYLFFVSPDGGPHRFSRTLAEHESHLR